MFIKIKLSNNEETFLLLGKMQTVICKSFLECVLATLLNQGDKKYQKNYNTGLSNNFAWKYKRRSW